MTRPTKRSTVGSPALRILGSLACWVVSLGATVSSQPPAATNLRPVIGVFSQDTDTVTASSTIAPDVKAELSAFRYLIPASYVKWIGQAGGRVLPILLDQPAAYYDEVFAQTNGILFPGGNQGIDPSDIYTEEGEIIWKLAKRANDRGDYYPIWGTCLGFEELAVLETGNGDVISLDVTATNLALPLQLTPGARQSRLFRSFPPTLMRALQSQNLTFNSHDHGLLVSEYESTSALSTFFAMLSFNETAAGQFFVSTMEARQYPFYGTQWHPEKNNFEWSENADYSNIPHSPNAILASQATARFLLDEARKSRHVFPEARRDALIYSAPVVYTGKDDWIYEQVYVFCPRGTTHCPAEGTRGVATH
jgi:gamma-glutamyl hydrolase